jgi:hypothetical protein
VSAALAEANTQRALGVLGVDPLRLTEIGSLAAMFRPYSSPPVEPVTEAQIAKLQELEATAQTFWDSLQLVCDPKALSSALRAGRSPVPKMFELQSVEPGQPAGWWDDVDLQKQYAGHAWYQISVRFENLTHKLETLRSRLVPKSMLFLLMILAALLIVGAVIPMGYLSAQHGSSKVYLLAAFATLSVAVVGVLGYEMMRIRRAARLDLETF